ncbi:MAG: hypothetical protein IPM77_15950 [Crocinitomicaceae bacterium]|nr:hypothetical protein [Crocinitomicaceae bacterium]
MKKLLVAIAVLVVFNSIGQDKDIPFDKRLFEDRKEEFDKAVAEIKEGDFYFYDGASSDLTLALDHYLKAQAFNPYSSMLNFKVGVCYLYSNQNSEVFSILNLHTEFFLKWIRIFVLSGSGISACG